MGECHKIRCSVMAYSQVAVLWGWTNGLLEVQFPKSRVRGASSLQDKHVLVADGYGGGSECDLAPGIAKLSYGQEWFVGQGRDDVSNAGGMWQARDVKFSIMCGVHDAAVGVLNAEQVEGGFFVAHRCVHG